MFHKKRCTSNKKKQSDVWTTFEEIFSTETKQPIAHFFYCTTCTEIVENLSTDGNTNKLRRHVCNGNDNRVMPAVLIATIDKEKLKMASANFVAQDLRPFYAIECKGLRDLCYTCMTIGQKYRSASREDFDKMMPSRNTVKSAIAIIADNKRSIVSQLLKRAMSAGGIAATTDTWTDDYRHTTYVCVVAHVAIVENGEISYHRHVISTEEVSEIIKTGINNFVIFRMKIFKFMIH